jgi:flagellar protein FlaG
MDVSGVEITAVPVIQAGSSQMRRTTAEDSKDGHKNHEEIIHIMQEQLDSTNVSLKYFTYGESGERTAVAVVNTISGEIVREIPSKELRGLYTKMNELVGMILNRQI